MEVTNAIDKYLHLLSGKRIAKLGLMLQSVLRFSAPFRGLGARNR